MFRMTQVVAVAAAGILSAALAMPASAQDTNVAWLVAEMQEMREELRMLRGQIEDQQREIERLNQRQRDQYLDLDQRIQQSGTAPPREPTVGTVPDVAGEVPPETDVSPAAETPPVAQQDVPEVRGPVETQPEVTPLPAPIGDGPRDLGTPGEAEQAAYDDAFRALRELRYADAAEGFDRFLRQYPDSSYAPNAQYWLGEAYYVNRDFETSLSTFQTLLSRYPGSSKEGDALLKIGFSHYELRQWAEARAALEEVRSKHAGTTLARLAENRLRTMRLEGHY